MKIKDLRPGDKVDMQIMQLMMSNPDGQSNEGKYFTTIFDVNEDDTIDINVPIVQGKYILLKKDIRYSLIFHTSNGFYKAEGTIVDHVRREGFLVLKTVLTTAIEKQQRREFYRLDCTITSMFMGLTEEAAMQGSVEACENMMEDFDDLKVRGIGTLLDISGGGTRFVTSNSLANIKYILLRFKVNYNNRERDIEIVGEVLGTNKVEKGEKYVHRVRFMHKSEKEKEELISFIFEEERRIRRKEQGFK